MKFKFILLIFFGFLPSFNFGAEVSSSDLSEMEADIDYVSSVSIEELKKANVEDIAFEIGTCNKMLNHKDSSNGQKLKAYYVLYFKLGENIDFQKAMSYCIIISNLKDQTDPLVSLADAMIVYFLTNNLISNIDKRKKGYIEKYVNKFNENKENNCEAAGQIMNDLIAQVSSR